MSTRDLTTLADHAVVMSTDIDTPTGERDLWRAISREIRAYLGREQVRMAGNAVTPPAARDLIATAVAALDGTAA